MTHKGYIVKLFFFILFSICGGSLILPPQGLVCEVVVWVASQGDRASWGVVRGRFWAVAALPGSVRAFGDKAGQ